MDAMLPQQGPEGSALTPHLVNLINKPVDEVRKGVHDKDNALHFRAFALAMSRQCKSQLFQDAWALWQSDGREAGYFVEFGAGNGVRLSNSYLLEKSFAWKGVLAEPHPGFSADLRAKRSCYISEKCVFSRSGETLSFMAAADKEYSRIASIDPRDKREHRREQFEEVSVQSISLNDLLIEAAAPAEIDYLSVDTEGSELEILGAFDFGRWEIKAITVEHNRTPLREEIRLLLTRHGYRRVWPEITRFDDWYVLG